MVCAAVLAAVLVAAVLFVPAHIHREQVNAVECTVRFID